MYIYKWKINLINLTPESLKKLMLYLRFKVFVYKQILYWLYKTNVNVIFAMKNIKDKYKSILNSISNIFKLTIISKFIDVDNSIKFILELEEKKRIEAVFIPNRKNHYTLCVSSQIGCVLNCSFCYTGKIKFIRNLKPFEIMSQILLSRYILKKLFANKILTNIVFMGMGEPLFNLSNLLAVIDIIIKTCSISKNKITVSTSGISDYFYLLFTLGIRIALSLHASNDILRDKLMPINKKYSLMKLLSVCKNIIKSDFLTIEYVMLDGVNDSINHASELVFLLKDIKCKICLIPFNYFPGSFYSCSSRETINKFKNFLIMHNITTTVRKTLGSSIYAACGQLAGKYEY